MNNNYENSQANSEGINRTMQYESQLAFSYTQIGSNYLQSLMDTYNSALMLQRDQQRMTSLGDVFNETRPDYFQTSLKTFVIKSVTLEGLRETSMESIKGLDENSLDELVSHVKKAVQARALAFNSSVPEIQSEDVKQVILNFLSHPVLDAIDLELYGLYIQSLPDEEKAVLATCDTEKALLDSVRKKGRVGDENFERRLKLKVDSVKREGFSSSEIPTITSTIEDACVVASNELKRLGIASQLDSHHKLI